MQNGTYNAFEGNRKHMLCEVVSDIAVAIGTYRDNGELVRYTAPITVPLSVVDKQFRLELIAEKCDLATIDAIVDIMLSQARMIESLAKRARVGTIEQIGVDTHVTQVRDLAFTIQQEKVKQ